MPEQKNDIVYMVLFQGEIHIFKSLILVIKELEGVNEDDYFEIHELLEVSDGKTGIRKFEMLNQLIYRE
jgi:hypothetical protein